MGTLTRLDLKARIVLIASGAILFAMTAVIAVNGVIFNREYSTALESRALAIATSLKVELERVLQLGIPLHNLIGFEVQCSEAVKEYGGVSYAMVVDPAGKVLFHSSPGVADKQLTNPALLAALRGSSHSVTSYTEHHHAMFAAVVPVKDVGGNHQASIVVGFPASIINAKARQMVAIGMGLGLFFTATAIFAQVATLSALVTNPLSRLVRTLTEIRRDTTDLSKRVTVHGTGDIVRLVDAFNGLMADLQNTTVSKTELEKTNHVLQEAEARYHRVVESSPSAIFVDFGQRLVFANPAAIALLKARDASDIIDRPLLDFVHRETRDLVRERLAELLNGEQTVHVPDVRIVRSDGEIRDVEVVGIAFVYDGLPAAQVVMHDVTETRQKTAEMAHLASHDALTDLPNRVLTRDRLEKALAYAQRSGRHTTVLFLDIDNFKFINDSLGHDMGDVLLTTVANRLSACLRGVDTVGRIGGDEFVIVLFDQPSGDDTEISVLERIQATIARPVVLKDHEYTVTASIGFAIYPRDGDDAETLLRNADEAMYRAKELGRNNYQPYSAELHSKLTERLALHNGLTKALERNELVVFYQPQVEIRSGHIIAVEALVRWHHPERGLLSPGSFIELAEETGLIGAIGEFVLRSACAQAKTWQSMGLPPLRVAVNVSPRQFWQTNLIDLVGSVLRDSDLDANYLELELTEGLIMHDADKAVTTMNALRATGVALAIDDFGTGYSSLAALQQFPIGRLKIAQFFLRDIPENPGSVSIAQAIISLGHSLNLNVIAEGVETQRQLEFLKSEGCHEIQGYLVSKPVPGDDIPKLVKPT